MNNFSELNDQQRQIVENGNGVVIIKAGPGTGKTKTLTSRVAYLLTEKKVKPENILALTFTKRAAAQMKDRIKLLLKNKIENLPLVTTFHSFAYDVLLGCGKQLKIISDKQQKDIFKKINNNTIPARKFFLCLTRYKNKMDVCFNKETISLINKYNTQLKENQLVDFDNLLLELFELLNSDRQIRKKLQNRYLYILVDEFQDTNNLQYQILKLIKYEKNNLFVIGDPYQSIYFFRGANAQIFKTLKTDFPKAREITLTINYRSHKRIVDISNRLFDLNLHSFSDAEGEVGLIKTLNEYSEADWIVKFINNKIGGSEMLQAGESLVSVRFSDFAIIFRTHKAAIPVIKKLFQSGLPYQTIGHDSIYEQIEVKYICLILAYLNEKTTEKLQEILECEYIGINNIQLSDIQEKINSLDPLSLSLSNLVQLIIPSFGLSENELSDNIKCFIGNIIQFDQFSDGLARFCRYLDTIKNYDYYDSIYDKITLLTMHAAKGLEFKYVFICGFEEGLIPYRNKTGEELEEEKRLFYVAMTRAKEALYLLETKHRYRKQTQTSSFNKHFQNSILVAKEDDQTQKILKRQEKNRIKKSQMKMF